MQNRRRVLEKLQYFFIALWNFNNPFYNPNLHQIKIKNEKLIRDILILLDAATKNNSPLKARIDELKIQAEKYDAEISQLQTQNIDEYWEYEMKIKELNDKVDVHKSNLKQWKSDKENSENKIKGLESEIEKYKADKENSEEEIKKLQSKIKKCNKEIEEYRSQSKTLDNLLSEIKSLGTCKKTLAKDFHISEQQNKKNDENNMTNLENKKLESSIANSSSNKLEHENIELVSRTIKIKETKRYGSKKN